MTLLIFGNILWIIAHTFKRLLPNFRNSLGNAGKGAVAFLIIISLVLMILGYRSAEYIGVWTPPQFFLHINNLMMVAAVFVFAIGHTKRSLTRSFAPSNAYICKNLGSCTPFGKW